MFLSPFDMGYNSRRQWHGLTVALRLQHYGSITSVCSIFLPVINIVVSVAAVLIVNEI